MKHKRCDRCGQLNPASSRKCARCGKALPIEPPAPAGHPQDDRIPVSATPAESPLGGSRPTDLRREETVASAELPTTKKCPFCAELIQADAVFCRFCRRDIAATNAPPSVSDTAPRPRVPLVAGSTRASVPPSRAAVLVEIVLGVLGVYGLGHLLCKRWLPGIALLLFSPLWLVVEGYTKDVLLAGDYPVGTCALGFHVPIMLASVAILSRRRVMVTIGGAFLCSLTVLFVPQMVIVLLQMLDPGPADIAAWIMERVFQVSANVVGWFWIALAVGGVYRWLKGRRAE